MGSNYRTQLRLQQLTGSIQDIAFSGSQTSAASAIDGTILTNDLDGILGQFAGAIGRITGRNGAGTSGFTNVEAGNFHQSLSVTGSFLSFNQAATISVAANALTLDAPTGIVMKENGSAIVTISNDRDITTTNTRQVHLDASGVINLNSSAGVISIGNDDVDQNINIGTDGTRTIAIGEAADSTLTLKSRGGTFSLDGTGQTVDLNSAALDIDASGAVTIDGTSTISIDGAGNFNLDTSSGTLSVGTANSGIAVSIGHTTSEVTVNDNLTVTGDLTVNGATTTIATTNLVVKDPVIMLASGAIGANQNAGLAIVSGSDTASQAMVFGRVANDTWGVGRKDVIDGTVTTLADMTLTNFRAKKFELVTSDEIGLDVTGSYHVKSNSAITASAGVDFFVDATRNIILDADNGEITFQDGGTAFLKLENASGDVKFLDKDAAEIFRLDESANSMLMANGIPLQFGNTNVQIKNDGNNMKFKSNNIEFTMPSADGSENHVLTTNGSKVLSFSSINTIVSSGAVKRVMQLSGSRIASGSALDPNGSEIGNGALAADFPTPSSRANLNLGDFNNDQLDTLLRVFVNGQLLVSGSSKMVGLNTADYILSSSAAGAWTQAKFRFGFDLEADDTVVVQIQ